MAGVLMARPYSLDLRTRVLRAHEAGEGGQRVLAKRFGVGVGAVCGWLAAARDEGRRGARPHGGGRRAPGGWRRLTILGAIAMDGLVAAMTVAAATTTQVFLAFVEQALLPALRGRPGCVVVMDNSAPHKAACVRAAFEAAGISCRYLPPCSPDLNPIKSGWAVMKAELRRTEARDLDQLDAALPHALGQITPSRAQGWFRHAGYRSQ